MNKYLIIAGPFVSTGMTGKTIKNSRDNVVFDTYEYMCRHISNAKIYGWRTLLVAWESDKDLINKTDLSNIVEIMFVREPISLLPISNWQFFSLKSGINYLKETYPIHKDDIVGRVRSDFYFDLKHLPNFDLIDSNKFLLVPHLSKSGRFADFFYFGKISKIETFLSNILEVKNCIKSGMHYDVLLKQFWFGRVMLRNFPYIAKIFPDKLAIFFAKFYSKSNLFPSPKFLYQSSEWRGDMLSEKFYSEDHIFADDF